MCRSDLASIGRSSLRELHGTIQAGIARNQPFMSDNQVSDAAFGTNGEEIARSVPHMHWSMGIHRASSFGNRGLEGARQLSVGYILCHMTVGASLQSSVTAANAKSFTAWALRFVAEDCVSF